MRPRPANHPITAQMSGTSLQFKANHDQADKLIQFFATGPSAALFVPLPSSVMVFAQQNSQISIDDPSEEFVLSLIFVPSQQNANTQTGHRTLSDPLLNAEPSQARDSVVHMKLDGIHPIPTLNGMEQPPGTLNYFIVNGPTR